MLLFAELFSFFSISIFRWRARHIPLFYSTLRSPSLSRRLSRWTFELATVAFTCTLACTRSSKCIWANQREGHLSAVHFSNLLKKMFALTVIAAASATAAVWFSSSPVSLVCLFEESYVCLFVCLFDSFPCIL